MQSISCKVLDWMKHKPESRLPGEVSIASDMQIKLPLWQKLTLDENERGEWKSWFKIQKTKIMASGPITSCQIDGETMETVTDFIFCGSNHCRWWLRPWNYKTLAPWKKSYDQPRQHIKKQRHYFANQGLSSQSYSFSSSHVWMWEFY